MKGVGIFSNCGSYRPKWLRRKSQSTSVTFTFSVEVPMGEENVVVGVIREGVEDLVTRWSRSCYRSLKKREREERQKQ